MIITKQKPFEEIMRFLESSPEVFIVGCSLCTITCKTGGEGEVNAVGQEN